MAIALRTPVGLRTSSVAPARSRAAVRVICKAQPEEHVTKKFALPVATLVATAMLSGAMIMPEEALAAKSSGRVGGSSGFKSRRMEASSSPASRSQVVNNTVVVAPPVVAPPLFGFGMPFGGFGYGGFGMGMGIGFPVFGGLLQFFLVLTLVSVVFSVIRGLMNSGSKNKNKDDGWGEL